MAGVFFNSGLVKIRDFESTIFLFEIEYNVPLLPPYIAAYLGTFNELFFPILLCLGLFTRLASLPLFIMTLVIQFTYLNHITHLYWAFFFLILLVNGGGIYSLDWLFVRAIRPYFPQLFGRGAWAFEGLKRIVVVGGGFAGLNLVRRLAKQPCQVILIDRTNHHLFQPLLYHVATASLAPADVALPLRSLLSRQANCQIILGEVIGIERISKKVRLQDKREIPYDHLILATGAQPSYPIAADQEFWQKTAPSLKTLEGAITIRRRLLMAFEHAENATDEIRCQAALTFVIIGAGPMGVELAAALAELAQRGMERRFHLINPAMARVILLEEQAQILPDLSVEAANKATKYLKELNVDIRLGSKVITIDSQGVKLASGEVIQTLTPLWAGGVGASPVAEWVHSPADAKGRLLVQENLSLPGQEDIFVIGDAALCMGANGQPVPRIARVAIAQGNYLGKYLSQTLRAAQKPFQPFQYRASISYCLSLGRRSALYERQGRSLWGGRLVWWGWSLWHLSRLTAFAHKLSWLIKWVWAYLTYKRNTRLIGLDPPKP
jgi:NADH dehydrogenase FAD-containing subunit/uncharacterized membrane protein YphA (DoxX/SURF4 family)